MLSVTLSNLVPGSVTGAGRTVLAVTTPQDFPGLRTVHYFGGFTQTASADAVIQIRPRATLSLDKSSIGL